MASPRKSSKPAAAPDAPASAAPAQIATSTSGAVSTGSRLWWWLALFPVVCFSVFHGLNFWLRTKTFEFTGKEIEEVTLASFHAGPTLEERMANVTAELRLRHPGLLLPEPEHVFFKAGGWIGSYVLLYASLSEYVLFFGTGVDTVGHSGRYWAEIQDTILSGHFRQWPEGGTQFFEFGPGETVYHPAWLATAVQWRHGTWMVEYARGVIPSTMSTCTPPHGRPGRSEDCVVALPRVAAARVTSLASSRARFAPSCARSLRSGRQRDVGRRPRGHRQVVLGVRPGRAQDPPRGPRVKVVERRGGSRVDTESLRSTSLRATDGQTDRRTDRQMGSEESFPLPFLTRFPCPRIQHATPRVLCTPVFPPPPHRQPTTPRAHQSFSWLGPARPHPTRRPPSSQSVSFSFAPPVPVYGPTMKERREKRRKSTPPAIVTVRSLMRVARNLPPTTARPVQMACPTMPPSETPTGSLAAAIAIVVIWLRSPHSARKVSVNACVMMAQYFRACGVALPVAGLSNVVHR